MGWLGWEGQVGFGATGIHASPQDTPGTTAGSCSACGGRMPQFQTGPGLLPPQGLWQCAEVACCPHTAGSPSCLAVSGSLGDRFMLSTHGLNMQDRRHLEAVARPVFVPHTSHTLLCPVVPGQCRPPTVPTCIPGLTQQLGLFTRPTPLHCLSPGRCDSLHCEGTICSFPVGGRASTAAICTGDGRLLRPPP